MKRRRKSFAEPPNSLVASVRRPFERPLLLGLRDIGALRLRLHRILVTGILQAMRAESYTERPSLFERRSRNLSSLILDQNSLFGSPGNSMENHSNIQFFSLAGEAGIGRIS